MTNTPNDAGRAAVQAVEDIAEPADRARVAGLVGEEMERIRLAALGQVAKTTTLRQIGADLLGGVSPQRADQIVKNFRRGSLDRAAYAVRDTTDGATYGPWDALPDGQFDTAPYAFNPVSPSPFAGRPLEVRYGPWTEGVNTYALHLGAKGETVMRDTVELHGILFPGRPPHARLEREAGSGVDSNAG